MGSDLVQSGFDYATVPTEHRGTVEAATRRLHTLERKTSEAIIEIGKELISVKASIGHGNFLPWLEAEFGWSEPTAQRFMRVASSFKSVKLTDLENIAPSALYALASPSTPDDVRVEFTELAAMGKPVRHQDVRQEIDRRKRAEHIPARDWEAEPVDAETGEILDDGPPPYEEVDPSDPATFLEPMRPRPASTRQPDPIPEPDPVRDEIEFTNYGPDFDNRTARSMAVSIVSRFGDGFANRLAAELRKTTKGAA